MVCGSMVNLPEKKSKEVGENEKRGSERWTREINVLRSQKHWIFQKKAFWTQGKKNKINSKGKHGQKKKERMGCWEKVQLCPLLAGHSFSKLGKGRLASEPRRPFQWKITRDVGIFFVSWPDHYKNCMWLDELLELSLFHNGDCWTKLGKKMGSKEKTQCQSGKAPGDRCECKTPADSFPSVLPKSKEQLCILRVV